MINKDKNGHFLGRLLRWLIPLGISAGAIWLVLRDISFSQFISNLSRIGFQTYLLATLAFFVSYSFRVYCWYILMRRKVSYKDAFFTMGAGYLLNNLFPFRLGEIGRAVLLAQPDKVSGLEVLSSILVERVFDVFLAALFVLSMLPRILGGGFDQTLILIAFVMTLVGLIGLFLAAKFRKHIMTWIEKLGNRITFIKTWIAPKAMQVLEGLSVLTNPGAFALAFSALVVSWFIAFGKNYIIFNSLSPNPPFWWMIFVLSAGAFGAALPSAPAGLGVYEGVIVAAFALLGVEADLAFTHAIVTHLLVFIYTNIVGLIGLQMRGEAVVSLYRRVIHRPSEVSVIE